MPLETKKDNKVANEMVAAIPQIRHLFVHMKLLAGLD